MQNGSTITRTPYVGNVIPQGQLNLIAQKYMQYYPDPNVTVGVSPTGVNNYVIKPFTPDSLLERVRQTMAHLETLDTTLAEQGIDVFEQCLRAREPLAEHFAVVDERTRRHLRRSVERQRQHSSIETALRAPSA